MLKRIFFWTVIIFLNLFVIIAMGEVYARVKHPGTLNLKMRMASYRRADFKVDHSLIPNSKGYAIEDEFNVPYYINSLGLRDREYSIERQPNTFRILAIGDSFTEGHGVRIEDSYVKILERKLNEELEDDIEYEVINGGIGAYSPLLEYLFLTKRLLRLDPDLVVLFYDFSDLRDDYEYEKTTIFDKNGIPLECRPYKRIRAYSFHPLERFLIKHLRFYLYVENRINKKLFKLRYKQAGYKKTEELKLHRLVPFKEDSQTVKRLWSKNKKHLGLVHEALKKRDIPFVIVSYPYAMEVSSREWVKGRILDGFEPGKVYDQPEVVDFLAKFAEEKGIYFINVYDDFKESDIFPLYFEVDSHFNENGHALMAKSLFEKLLFYSIITKP